MRGLAPLFLFLLFIGESSSARVFSFKSERIASYFRANGGISRLGTSAFSYSSGEDTTFDGGRAAYNFGGEIGFLFTPHESFSLSFGLELLQGQTAEVVGSNAAEAKLFDLTSKVFVMNPTMSLEIYFYQTAYSRAAFVLGGGWASVSMDNAYTFTAQGLSDLQVTEDYTEKTEGTQISALVAMAFETHFTDNVTAYFDVGYRHLPFSNLSHKAAIPDPIGSGSAIKKGDSVRDHNGAKRVLDLSGAYVGIAFRFFFDTR